jgi:hypothetical protein
MIVCYSVGYCKFSSFILLKNLKGNKEERQENNDCIFFYFKSCFVQ